MKWTLLCCALLCSTLLLAQQKFTISGYVEDAETGEKLIGANVVDVRLMKGTTANEYGFFSLTLPADSVQLAVSFVGYDTYRTALWLNKDMQLNVPLREGNVLKEVEVKATQAGEAIQERTQMSSVSIPIKQIQSLPAFMGEVDVIKVLQLMPGVQSGTEGSSGLFVRGGSPDQNLILLDGVPVYNVSHLFGFFSVFDANAINSVELIKGGYPARYGGRLSSVLDIRMKEGNMKTFSGNASIGIISSKLSLEAPIVKDKCSFIVSGRRTYIDLLARPLIMAQTNGNSYGGYYFHDFSAKLNYKFSEKDRLYISGYTGDDNFYFRDKTAGDLVKGNIGWGNMTAVTRWNHVFNPKLFSNTTITYTRYKLRNEFSFDDKEDNESDIGSFYSSSINDFAAKMDLDYVPSPNHYIKAGVAATQHYFKPAVQQFKAGGGAIDTTLSGGNTRAIELDAYVEDDYKISNRLKANIGLHWSGFAVDKTFYNSLQPRLATRFLLNDKISLKASYAYMMQYLHLLTTSSALSLPTDIWVPVTAKVEPQVSHQVAIGAAYNLAKQYELSIEAYYKDMRNLLEYKEGASYFSNSGGTWEDLVEVGKGNAYGAEFLIQRKEGKLTGWIGYTLAWSNRQFENLNFGKTYPYKFDARHDFVIAAVYRPKPRIELAATWIYRTGNALSMPLNLYADDVTPVPYNNYDGDEIQYYDGRNGFRMNPYHRLDIGISFIKPKKKGESRWNIDIYNAYNRKNPFFMYRGEAEINGTTQPAIKQVSLFPILPSISYNRSW